MTNNRRTVVAAAVLIVVAAVVWIAWAARDAGSGRAPVTPRASTQAEPGMDDMAGMDMGGDGTVRLTAQQIRQFGVTFGSAEMRVLADEIRATGQVTEDETRVAQVALKFSGFAERLYVDHTGQAVQRGQPLLEVYSSELVAAQQELLVAQRLDRSLERSSVPGAPAGGSNLLDAAKRRLQLWDIPDAQIEEVLRTGEARRTMTIPAPASGVVTQKHVVRGQAVPAGMPLYTIVDLSEVWVEIEVREADAPGLRRGADAVVELTALPGQPFRGRVSFVYPELDRATRSVRARVSVANPAMRLKPGMYATVRLSSPARRALTIPASALIRTGERNVVFVDMGAMGGGLMPLEVEVGRATSDYVEILSGVEPGQRVVTSAQFLLESESNIAQVMKAMIGQMSSGDMGQMKDMPGIKMP